MTNCGLWLNHKWVKTPLTPLTRTPVGWGASGTFLNGGAYALASKTRHYEISAQWMGTQAEIASIIDEIDTGEPIYMTDPFSYANILPHWLAKPQAMTKDAPYFTAVRPTLSTTPVEDARNLCPNPTAVAGGAWTGSPNSGACTITRSVDVPPTPNGTTTATQCQATTGNALLVSVFNADGLGSYAETRVVSLLIRSNVDIEFRPNTGGGWVTYSGGEWHAVTATVTPGNFTIQARPAGGTAVQATDRFWWTDITTADTFFTGDTPHTDTHQYAWAGTPHNSASVRYLVGKNIIFTGTGTKTFTVSVPEGGGRFVWYGSGSGVMVNGVSRTVGTVVSVPAGLCTIGMTGLDPRTVDGMVLSVGQEPVQGTPGQGYTQVQCTSVSVTGYSAPSAIDRVGLSATFIEVGGWR